MTGFTEFGDRSYGGSFVVGVVLRTGVKFIGGLPGFDHRGVAGLRGRDALFLCAFRGPLVLSFCILGSVQHFHDLGATGGTEDHKWCPQLLTLELCVRVRSWTA